MKNSTFAAQLKFAAAALVMLATTAAHAATIQFNVTVTPNGSSGGTWSVSATDLGGDNKGIAGFDIDVLGLGGIVIGKASPVSQTLQAPNLPFSLFRSTGTLASPNLNAITAFQDTPSAFNNNDDSALIYQEGIGAAMPIAKGTFTGSIGFGPSITVQPEFAAGLPSITVFPLNYDVTDVDGSGNLLPGNTAAVTQVTGYTVVYTPEPASFFLMGMAGVGLALARRRSRPRCANAATGAL
jgi:PEP-CTERM motif